MVRILFKHQLNFEAWANQYFQFRFFKGVRNYNNHRLLKFPSGRAAVLYDAPPNYPPLLLHIIKLGIFQDR